MMKSTSVFRLTVLAGLLMTAGVANAASPVNTVDINPGWTQVNTAPNTWTDSFSFASGAGTFETYFTFNNPVPAPNAGTSHMSLSMQPTQGLINVFNLLQYVNNAWQTITTGTISGGGTFADIALNTSLDTTSLYALDTGWTVASGSSGSGNGTITVSAVPEPKTYAMLLAGLGLLAFTARRRKSNNSFFAY